MASAPGPAVGGPPYALADEPLLRQCRVESLRTGGPGGQHRNRTETAVRLTHLATGVAAHCQDHRERPRNQAEALRHLRLALALALRGQADPAWLVPWRRGARLALGAAAQGYHLAVACALDALADHDGRLPEAAAALGISTSQLAKLLTADHRVHDHLNRDRAARGLGPIHGR